MRAMTTPDDREVVERAAKLVPALAARASEAEALRHLPRESIDDLVDAGFFAILAPRSRGGRDGELRTLVEVSRVLGAACGSTAWIVALLGVHNWLLGLLPEAIQQEVYGAADHVLAPAIFAPQGQLTPSDGGFELSGRWGFASGCKHARWALLSAVVEAPAPEPFEHGPEVQGGRAPEARLALVPMDALTLRDTWRTSGMRGTGSHDLVASRCSVPRERTLSLEALVEGEREYAEPDAGPQRPLMPTLTLVAAAPALGIAEGAIDAFTERSRSRLLLSGARQQERAAAQIRLAEANLELQSARALVEGGVAEIDARTAAGGRFGRDDRARLCAEGCYAVTLCTRAIDRLVEAAGGRAHFESSPLQRCQRDIHTLRGHVVFDFDSVCESYGRTLLGAPPSSPLV